MPIEHIFVHLSVCLCARFLGGSNETLLASFLGVEKVKQNIRIVGVSTLGKFLIARVSFTPAPADKILAYL